ncbi:hypothetical protein QFZ75_003674 [Streptomyces sp. V3I8]|nr:hypothetical protein [Streptomyces sp. V3I8]
MLAHTVHDVRVTAELRPLPPKDGWACWGKTGLCQLTCSCGHTEGPIPTSLARLVATLHIHGSA